MSNEKDILLTDIAKARAARGRKTNGNGHAAVVLPIQYDQRFDDVATAERFLSDWGDEICYQPESRKWMVWNGKRWQEDKQEAVFSLAIAFAKDLYSPEHLTSNDAIKYTRRVNNNAGLNAFLSIAAKKKTVPIAAFDTQKYLINCLNGTLDLRTGEISPHDRTQLLTRLVNCEYDPEAHSPLYAGFLQTVQPDPVIRAFLQRSIGYSLLGTVRERAFWVLLGTGNNGKSIFLNLFNSLLGEYASGTTAGSIMSNNPSAIPNDIARLNGKRFVMIPETPENERLNAAVVKALSSGDTITARFLFGEYFDFAFSGKLWIATNHMPRITDHSAGFWQRIKIVPFAQDIPAEKIIKSDDLMRDLLQESAGIFAWAVQGCRDYFEVDGLDTPPVIQDEVDAHRRDQDLILQFLDECCETYIQARARSPDGYINEIIYRVSNTDLYEAFRKFSGTAGEKTVLSHRRFTQEMRDRGFQQKNSMGRYWDGVRLIDNLW